MGLPVRFSGLDTYEPWISIHGGAGNELPNVFTVTVGIAGRGIGPAILVSDGLCYVRRFYIYLL